MIFLIEYDRARGELVNFRAFQDSERSDAENSRLEMELNLNREGIEHEVVLLEAANEDALRRTHRRYFENLDQIGRSGFTVLDVDWEYQAPRVFTGTRDPRAPIRIGVTHVDLRCNRCGTEWNASKAKSAAPGTFLVTIGHLIPTCPKCRQSQPIANTTLEPQKQES